MWWMALHMEKTPMRLATKLGVSLAWTTIPCRAAAPMKAAMDGGDRRVGVAGSATTSTSRM